MTIDEISTLEDVCFIVSTALDEYGITGVLTGGSAAAVYAPVELTSSDADFVLNDDEPLEEVAAALATVGFTRYGKSRLFQHPRTQFTVDFPKGPLAVGGEYVRETATLERGSMRLRILKRLDCVRDRLAHYYFWEDYTALNAAVLVAAELDDAELAELKSWTVRESPDYLPKFEELHRRLQRRGK